MNRSLNIIAVSNNDSCFSSTYRDHEERCIWKDSSSMRQPAFLRDFERIVRSWLPKDSTYEPHIFCQVRVEGRKRGEVLTPGTFFN